MYKSLMLLLMSLLFLKYWFLNNNKKSELEATYGMFSLCVVICVVCSLTGRELLKAPWLYYSKMSSEDCHFPFWWFSGAFFWALYVHFRPFELGCMGDRIKQYVLAFSCHCRHFCSCVLMYLCTEVLFVASKRVGREMVFYHVQLESFPQAHCVLYSYDFIFFYSWLFCYRRRTCVTQKVLLLSLQDLFCQKFWPSTDGASQQVPMGSSLLIQWNLFKFMNNSEEINKTIQTTN